MITKNQNIVNRKIHESYYLIDIAENYINNKCSLYEINEIGNFIWEQLDGISDIEQIVDAVVKSVAGDINRCDVYEDIKQFIAILLKEHFLEDTDECH